MIGCLHAGRDGHNWTGTQNMTFGTHAVSNENSELLGTAWSKPTPKKLLDKWQANARQLWGVGIISLRKTNMDPTRVGGECFLPLTELPFVTIEAEVSSLAFWLETEKEGEH